MLWELLPLQSLPLDALPSVARLCEAVRDGVAVASLQRLVAERRCFQGRSVLLVGVLTVRQGGLWLHQRHAAVALRLLGARRWVEGAVVAMRAFAWTMVAGEAVVEVEAQHVWLLHCPHPHMPSLSHSHQPPLSLAMSLPLPSLGDLDDDVPSLGAQGDALTVAQFVEKRKHTSSTLPSLLLAPSLCFSSYLRRRGASACVRGSRRGGVLAAARGARRRDGDSAVRGGAVRSSE